MKKLHLLSAAVAVILLLGATAVLQAGPPPDLQNRMRPAVHKTATTSKAHACNQAETACTNCQSCAGCPAQVAAKVKA